MSYEDIVDEWLLACAEVDYRLEQLRGAIECLPEAG